jgi:hypothetical protein
MELVRSSAPAVSGKVVFICEYLNNVLEVTNFLNQG